VTRVAREVGTEGKLGGQAEVRGVSGVWKDLTDNVNFMASNLTTQVRGIVKVVTAVANGDLSQKLVVEARGEIAALADTLNSMTKTLGIFAEQVIRPTGLIDPPVDVRPARTQVDDLVGEVRQVAQRGYRSLVTVLTKRMAEDLTEYLHEQGIRVRYMHSDIDTLERIEIIRDLRLGAFDALVGINLLREGLDIPECALVAILDADKEGFLRSQTSLIQTAGRAARHINGEVVLFADQVTKSMQALISISEYRRAKQMEYNEAHGITPQTVRRAVQESLHTILRGREIAASVIQEAGGDLLTFQESLK